VIPTGAQLVVEDGQKIQPGVTIAKVSREKPTAADCPPPPASDMAIYLDLTRFRGHQG